MRATVKYTSSALVVITFLSLVLVIPSSWGRTSETYYIVTSSGTVNSKESTLKRYTALNSLGSSITAEEAVEFFDMSQSPKQRESLIQAIHGLDPDYKALLYRNFAVVYDNVPEEWELFKKNEWVLKDADGRYVYVKNHPDDYFVDIGNHTYQEWLANWCKNNMGEHDGIFADVSFNIDYLDKASSTPLNPRTGTYWTDTDIVEAMIAMHNKVKDKIGSKLLICNGIWRGTIFFERKTYHIRVLQNSRMDGFMSEGIWFSYISQWYSESLWKQSLDFMIWVQDNYPQKIFVPVCRLWKTTGETEPLPSGCTTEQMMTYTICSTFLGLKTNNVYFGYTAPSASFIRGTTQPLFEIDLGKPLGNYYMASGTNVYVRDFENARVLVNPTNNMYIVGGITMNPHTGRVIEK